jgi:hypothetical protein
VLGRDDAERARRRDDRQAYAEQLAGAALAAFKQGYHDRALQLIDQAQLADPAYRPGRSDRRPHGASWDDIRQAMQRGRDTSPPAAGSPATPVPNTGPHQPTDGRAPAAAATDRPATAAELARLDTAPGAAAGPGTPAGARPAHPRSPVTTGRRTGPSV